MLILTFPRHGARNIYKARLLHAPLQRSLIIEKLVSPILEGIINDKNRQMSRSSSGYEFFSDKLHVPALHGIRLGGREESQERSQVGHSQANFSIGLQHPIA